MKKWILFLLLSFAVIPSAQAIQEFIVPEVGDGLNVRYIDNAANAPAGKTLLFVHGFTGTARTMDNLMTALVTDNKTKTLVKAVYAVDLPGHGASPYPTSDPKFGQLTLQDYADALISLIGTFKNPDLGYNIPIDVLAGHSMGGIIIQKAEQSLRPDSSLKAFGVDKILLLASTMPAQVGWEFADDNKAKLTALFLPYVKYKRDWGIYVRIEGDPDALAAWRGTFFGMPQVYPDFDYSNDLPATGTPDAASDTTQDVFGLASDEAYNALIEMVFVRPKINQGLFSDFDFASVAFGNDRFYTLAEQEELFNYLTTASSPNTHIFDKIVADDSGKYPTPNDQLVHMSVHTNPSALIPTIAKLLQ